jgi:Protein of unknown function (DUF2975)
LPDSHATALRASRALLRIWRVLNLGTAALLIVIFAASFIFEPVFREFFSKRPPRIDPGLLMPALRIWMLLALPMVAAVHVLLSRLLAMVETVRLGDPFVPENAVRMKTIAWCVLALELLHLAFGVMAAIVNAAGSNIEGWSFSLTGWVAVVLLFVLARVFEEGTRIRADLEAMI